jgi:spore germination protein
MPSPSPLPPNLVAGDLIGYRVLPGDTIKIIAEKFRTTEEAIIEANDISDPNLIYPGQILLVPVYLITPTFGPPPATESGSEMPTATSTETPSP